MWDFLQVLSRDHSSKLLTFLIKSRFLLATDRQTDRQIDKQTNRWTEPMRRGALVVASGAFITRHLAVAIRLRSYHITVLPVKYDGTDNNANM